MFFVLIEEVCVGPVGCFVIVHVHDAYVRMLQLLKCLVQFLKE